MSLTDSAHSVVFEFLDCELCFDGSVMRNMFGLLVTSNNFTNCEIAHRWLGQFCVEFFFDVLLLFTKFITCVILGNRTS